MRPRVAVIGAGNVGAATVNALVLLGAADHVVLYDRDASCEINAGS